MIYKEDRYPVFYLYVSYQFIPYETTIVMIIRFPFVFHCILSHHMFLEEL